VLSSDFNASGVDIQFATAIIILQPIRGEYSRIRQIEHQIIGRLSRIGQKNKITLIRLIISNSIETDIIRNNKIIDNEYINADKIVDYPHTHLEEIIKDDV
jgi:hypothetical protein